MQKVTQVIEAIKDTENTELQLFSQYMRWTNVPELNPKLNGDPRLVGVRIGIINGSSWVSLWSSYFGRKIIPEAQLINVGNDGVQLNFMQAHAKGLACPPQINIDLFVEYALQLNKLYSIDAFLVSCSTMNRSIPSLQKAVEAYSIPVLSIDTPMMDRAIEIARNYKHSSRVSSEKDSSILIIASHGPTVKSTRMLLEERMQAQGIKSDEYSIKGVTVEDAFHYLGQGDVKKHNQVISDAIRKTTLEHSISVVVLAQLSMSVFKIEYPNPKEDLGVDVLCSGEEGYRGLRELLLSKRITA